MGASLLGRVVELGQAPVDQPQGPPFVVNHHLQEPCQQASEAPGREAAHMSRASARCGA